MARSPGTDLIRDDAAEAFDVILCDAKAVGERGRFATQERIPGPAEPLSEILTMTLDVLVDGLLDQLRLLEPAHAGGVTDFLLRRLVNLDG
jgi:hypothetical protein